MKMDHSTERAYREGQAVMHYTDLTAYLPETDFELAVRPDGSLTVRDRRTGLIVCRYTAEDEYVSMDHSLRDTEAGDALIACALTENDRRTPDLFRIKVEVPNMDGLFVIGDMVEKDVYLMIPEAFDDGQMAVDRMTAEGVQQIMKEHPLGGYVQYEAVL